MTATAPFTAARRTLTAIASLVTIAALVVGVPYLLWRLAGWPLPGELPGSDGIARALSRTAVSDAAIVKAVALVGWFAWALLVWSLLAEAWAVIRGVPASRARLTAPFQGVARQLIASASLLAASGMSSATATPIAAAPQPVVVELRDPSPADVVTPIATVTATSQVATTAMPPGASTPPAAVAQPVAATPPLTSTQYTVQRHDSLWKIAECQLGDPLRWRELWELNRGRDFGGVTFANPSLIYAGWVLDMPTPAGAGPASTVAPTDSQDQPTPAPHAPPEVGADPVPDSTSSPQTGSSATTASTTTATTSTTHVPSATAPAARSAEPGPGRPTHAADEEPVSTPGRAPLFAGGVVLASAIVLLLTRLRRSQARRRPPGRPPHRPPADAASTEAAIRVAGDPARVGRAFAALRAFATGLGDTDMPSIAAVRVGDTEVEVLLASPATVVPAGFTSDPDRRVFTAEAEVTTTTLEGLAGDTTAPWLAVVAAGTVADDLVLIDLEAAGVLTVDGPDAADTVRRIAAELATSPASDLIELLVVGDELDIAGNERIRPITTVDHALDALVSSGTSTRAALDRLGDPNTAIARRDHSAEQGWGITVLVCMTPLSAAQQALLAKVALPGSGVAAVVVGEPSGDAWSLTTGPVTRLDPHGFDLSPATLATEDLTSVDVLLADAIAGDSDERLLADDSPADTIYLSDAVESVSTDPTPEVEVRVLGPVEVHGVDVINRRRTVELITYLALHPGGVSADRLKTAIWPEGEPTQGTFNVTVHRARSALGIDKDGNHHLPHAVTNGGNYSVGPHVAVDLARFNSLVRRARSSDGEAVEADLLRAAIGLLRGQVFEGVRGYEWAFTEAIVTDAEATISDAAHRLAQLELAQGHADAATWAATQGLKAVPGSEPLFRDRMEAAHLNGDPAAVDRIVDELCRYIETLEPLDDLHPDTIALWRRIGRPGDRGPRSGDARQ